MHDYDVLVDKISTLAGLEKEEVEKRIGEKKQKLSGLISKEGAAQIIAAELGINFEDQDFKIGELMSGMKKVSVIGKIIALFPIREFEKEGRSGKVANFVIADETGSTKVVLWDVNHISLLESGEIQKEDVIEIKNGSTRENEIHLSSFSELKKSTVVLDSVKTTEAGTEESSLDQARQGQQISVRGVVVQIFQPRFYSVCPECNKKVILEGEETKCLEHGSVKPKDRAILNFVLDDGTESMRVVMFSDQINSLVSEEDLKDADKALLFRDDFLGTEVYLKGPVKRNQLFNNLEIVASSVEKVDVEQLIEQLE